MYSLSENVQKNPEVIFITLNIVRISVDSTCLISSLLASVWVLLVGARCHCSLSCIPRRLRLFPWSASPAMSSLSVTEHYLDGIWCSWTFVHGFGSRSSAEGVWKRERATCIHCSPAASVGTRKTAPQEEQRKDLICPGWLHSTHTRCPCFCKAPHVVPFLSQSDRPSPAWACQICCTHAMDVCTFISGMS